MSLPRTLLNLGEPGAVTRVVFGCRAEDVAEDVVVTPFLPLSAFRRQAQGEVLDLAPPFFYKGFTGTCAGRRVTTLWTGVGPSRVGDALGFLSLTPARRVLFAGAVGGLRPEHGIGDLFVPTEAADGEGYTRTVNRPFPQVVAEAARVPAPPGPADALAGFLAGQGWVVRRGPVFTVGAITAESRENLATLARAGYHALEMELSAFFSAAAHHGLEAAALTYVSDLPLASSLWQEKAAGEQEALRRAYRALPALAFAALAALPAG